MIYVHPDRTGSVKSLGVNRLLVLHTSEGSESESAAENLCAFMGMPGDRPSSSGGRYGSSYHAVFDTDRWIQAVPDNVVAYSAAGANHDGIHGCFPGKAGQTAWQWLDDISARMIRQAAVWAVEKSKAHGIPLVRLSSTEVRNGAAGVCDHYDVSRAFGKSDHTDVGPGFPWAAFWAHVADLTKPPPTPPEDDEMARVIKLKGKPGAYVETTVKVWLPNPAARDQAIAEHGPMVELNYDEFVEAGPVIGDRPDGTDAYGVKR